MKTIKDVVAGDEVVMVYRTGRLVSGKSDDRIKRARVATAKPVNLEIHEIVDDHTARQGIIWTVRRDTRTTASNNHMYGWHAYTLDERESDERRLDAYLFLREQGIRIDFGSRWHQLDKAIELADAIRKHLAEKGE